MLYNMVENRPLIVVSELKVLINLTKVLERSWKSPYFWSAQMCGNHDLKMCSTKIWPFCSYLNVSTGKCCLQNESLCSSFNVLEIPPLFHIVQTQWNICLGELGHHSFRKWFVACSAPIHYLNQHLLVNLRNFNWMNWKCCLQNGSYFFLASNLLNHWDWMMHICITKQGQLTHWGRDKMDAISQTTFSHTISSMKTVVFWLNFHWNMFARVQLTII